MNLHTEHKLPLTHAYHAAVLQYRALRAEHKTMTQFAVLEAESYGATFTSGELERGYNLERAALKTWDPTAMRDLSMLRARKKWRPVVDKTPEQFTEGHEYAHAYEQGVVPTYREGTAESYVFSLPGEGELAEVSTVPPPQQ
jgi:small subunit ribosomal protein S23